MLGPMKGILWNKTEPQTFNFQHRTMHSPFWLRMKSVLPKYGAHRRSWFTITRTDKDSNKRKGCWPHLNSSLSCPSFSWWLDKIGFGLQALFAIKALLWLGLKCPPKPHMGRNGSSSDEVSHWGCNLNRHIVVPVPFLLQFPSYYRASSMPLHCAIDNALAPRMAWDHEPNKLP